MYALQIVCPAPALEYAVHADSPVFAIDAEGLADAIGEADALGAAKLAVVDEDGAIVGLADLTALRLARGEEAAAIGAGLLSGLRRQAFGRA